MLKLPAELTDDEVIAQAREIDMSTIDPRAMQMLLPIWKDYRARGEDVKSYEWPDGTVAGALVFAGERTVRREQMILAYRSGREKLEFAQMPIGGQA